MASALSVDDDVVPTSPSDADAHLAEDPVVGLADMSLAAIRASDDSVLKHVVARLVEDLRDPDEIVAGFDSSL